MKGLPQPVIVQEFEIANCLQPLRSNARRKPSAMRTPPLTRLTQPSTVGTVAYTYPAVVTLIGEGYRVLVRGVCLSANDNGCPGRIECLLEAQGATQFAYQAPGAL